MKDISKRDFLKRMSLLSGLALGAGVKVPLYGAETAKVALSPMPTVPFGKYKISKLIVGGNPISGNSHVSSDMSRRMSDYFSEENVLKLLSLCEEGGINSWQSRGDYHIMGLLEGHRNLGGKLHWIAQTASEMPSIADNIKNIAKQGAIGIYHHGSKTDAYWNTGQIDKVNEMLKVIRDTGCVVGMGSHMTEPLEYAEEKGWDIDYYMTCFYNPNKMKGKNDPKTGKLFRGEYYGDEDREKMCKFIKTTDKMCLGFKILAASRNAKTQEATKKAFEFAYKNMKPNDAVVVGMFLPYHVKGDLEIARTV